MPRQKLDPACPPKALCDHITVAAKGEWIMMILPAQDWMPEQTVYLSPDEAELLARRLFALGREKLTR